MLGLVAMKYCIKCVAKLPDNALFCSFCGYRQGDLKRNIFQTPPQSPPSIELTEVANDKKATDAPGVVVSGEEGFVYDLTSDNEGVLIKGLKIFDDVTSVIVPDKIEDMDVKEIAYGAFSGHEALSYVKLPAKLTVIKSRMFAGCQKLEEVDLPTCLQKIEERAFTDCRRLKCITLPESLASIEQYAFENCTSLTELKLPALQKIEEGAFTGCINLKTLSLPPNLLRIETKAFEGCCSLGSVHFPATLRYIEAHAFNNCANLKDVTIPPIVHRIEWGSVYSTSVFGGCPALSLKSKASIKKLMYKGRF